MSRGRQQESASTATEQAAAALALREAKEALRTAEERVRIANGETYRIALRPEQGHPTRISDVVVNDVEMVRIRRINGDWVIWCYLNGSEDRLALQLKGGLIVTERPEGVLYEEGSR